MASEFFNNVWESIVAFFFSLGVRIINFIQGFVIKKVFLLVLIRRVHLLYHPI